ncbi:MAG: T9SS type A sorting domain-containing protein, partial [Bacteroidia bacterium]
NSFTPHRCPLGLSFDKNNILASDLKGDGFLVSYTRGGDSTGLDTYGYPGTICDPGQDLLHIVLSPDGSGEYQMQATTIANNFSNPVDTYMDLNFLYVIEYSYSGNGRLFKVTLPIDPTGIQEKSKSTFISVYPNPTTNQVNFLAGINSGNIKSIIMKDLLGEELKNFPAINSKEYSVDLSSEPKGIYFMEITSESEKIVKKIILQ